MMDGRWGGERDAGLFEHESPRLRPTRILVVSHTYISLENRGKWLALCALEPALRVLLVVPRFWRDPELGDKSAVSHECSAVRVEALPTFGARNPGRYLFGCSLIGRIRSFNPDIIQVEAEPWSPVFAQVALFKRWFVPGAKVCVFSWWNTLRWATPTRFPGSVAYRLGLRAADLLIAGNQTGAQLHRGRGFKGPIDVIPQLGVSSPGEIEQAWGARPLDLGSDYVVGYVGRLTRQKGVQTLFEALAGLQGCSWKALIVGGGPEEEELRNQARRLGIERNIVFAGAVPRKDVFRYMKTMSVLVLPSNVEQWEQFGHVLVEAMACGVPVLGSASGEIPYVIDDPRCIFPIGDAASLRDKLLSLIRDTEFARDCRARGLRAIEERYSDRAIAARLLAAYASQGWLKSGCAEPLPGGAAEARHHGAPR